MANRKFWLGILVMVLVLGMTVVGCDNGSSSTAYNNDPGTLAGTWEGTVMGYYTATVTISNSGWTLSVPGLSHYDTGNFNRNGNTATLYSQNVGKVTGTATVINNDTIQLILNDNSGAPGTYTLTRQ